MDKTLNTVNQKLYRAKQYEAALSYFKQRVEEDNPHTQELAYYAMSLYQVEGLEAAKSALERAQKALQQPSEPINQPFYQDLEQEIKGMLESNSNSSS